MELINMSISCPETGLGSKQYIIYFFMITLSIILLFAQDIIMEEIPGANSAMFVAVIMDSDKIMVSVATGQTEYWPLYISIGNIHNNIHCGHGNGLVLVGFLAIPKSK